MKRLILPTIAIVGLLTAIHPLHADGFDTYRIGGTPTNCGDCGPKPPPSYVQVAPGIFDNIYTPKHLPSVRGLPCGGCNTGPGRGNNLPAMRTMQATGGGLGRGR